MHDMFGKEVVGRVRQGYGDAFHTAHFEVPGEMFALAMEAKQRGMGVVGSTSNILDFIKEQVSQALQRGFEDRLQFVLGTESGMVTSIVGAVRKLLADHQELHGGSKVEVEIVFPVSSEAISETSSSNTNGAYDSTLAKLSVVPGVGSGEGCSISGGCASCHYMKVGINFLPLVSGYILAYSRALGLTQTGLYLNVLEILVLLFVGCMLVFSI